MTLTDFATNPWLIIAALAVAVMGVGRLVRLITYDDYPPTIAIRSWWVDRVTQHNGWSKMLTCLWCFAPWAMLVALAWFAVGVLWVPWILVAWWIFWGWLGLSYLTSIIVRRDEPEGD